MARRRTTLFSIGAMALAILTAVAASIALGRRADALCAPAAAPAAPESPRFGAIELVRPTVINVRTAGARGDGVADDSDSIQQIINQAPDNTRFYFPSGTYRVASLA